MDNQQRINRRRNLPAELKVEIVDCLPLENAVHFLANVPSRLIIHHCAPRIRRILKKIGRITADYARKFPSPYYNDYIVCKNGLHYIPEMDIFLRYGTAHCRGFVIWGETSDGFVGFPANFFNDLIKYCYETKVPGKAVRNMVIRLSWANPAPWPAALVQPRAGKMKVVELEVDNGSKYVKYILRNKHNPDIAFKVGICFKRAKCYQQMTGFEVQKKDAQSGDQ